MKPRFLIPLAGVLLMHPSSMADDPHNPKPTDCCNCIVIKINNQSVTDSPGQTTEAIPADENGNYQFDFDVSIGQGGGCDEVEITSVTLRSANGHEIDIGQSGTQGVTGDLIDEHGKEWSIIVRCGGEADAAKESGIDLSNGATIGCEVPIKFGDDCETSCDGETGNCEPSASNGSFILNIPLGRAFAGDTKGTLRFYTANFANPGASALYAFVPSSFTVTSQNGAITEVEAPGSFTVKVDSTPTATDPNAFTVTHYDTTNTAFRVTTIGLVVEGGTEKLRADSTFEGTTYRFEQTQPENGTLVLESGRIQGGTFHSLRRETTITTKPEFGVEVRREKLEEREALASAYQLVSDVESRWVRFMWAWEKTEEVIDPDGEALTSTWTFYQPGTSNQYSIGRLKEHVRYDGYREFHSYGLNLHQTTVPFTINDAGMTIVRERNPAQRTETTTRRVGTNVVSKETVHFDSPNNKRTRTVHVSPTSQLDTVTTYVPYGQDFGGQPLMVVHPDDTVTTYEYSRPNGYDKRVIETHGAYSGGSVTMGMRTTTDYNRFGTVIKRVKEAVGYGTGTTPFEHMAVTSIDGIGRALTTAWFPSISSVSGDLATATDPKWTTTTEYSCCGIAKETDRYGIATHHAYDGLRRKVKTHRLGVTTETQFKGLTTETFRYAETVGGSLSSSLAGASGDLIGREVRNLARTLREFWSPDPTSSAAGTLVKTTTATTYKPISGRSRRVVTTTPDLFEQTEEYFLDGRLHQTSGALAADRRQTYQVGVNGLTTSASYLEGTTTREVVQTNRDWAGREFRTIYVDGAVSLNQHNSKGQLVKSTDPDGLVTLYAYNELGERTITAVDLNQNGVINHGTDQIRFTETVPTMHSSEPSWLTVTKVWQDGDTSASGGTVVSEVRRSPDGLFSSTESIGVSSPATQEVELLGNGAWTETTTSPDGSYTVTTYANGRVDTVERFDSGENLIASTEVQYDPLGRPTHQIDSRTGATVTSYLSATADVVESITDPGNRTTSFAYDVRGRRTTVDAPDTTDADNNALANVTTTSYFPDGRVDEVTGDQTYRVSYTYDYAGRQKTMTTYGTETATTTWTYSPARGFLTRKQYADGKGTDYTYTDAGRLETRTWARGVTTTYGYDEGGRLESTDYSDATPDVTIAYDALGRKTGATQGTARTWTYVYNPQTLRLEKEILPLGSGTSTRQIQRFYDSLGRPNSVGVGTSTTFNLDHEKVYNYDDAGRLGSVEDLSGVHTYGYVPNSGNLIASVTGPVHTVTNTWEPTRNVLDKKENEVGNSLVSSFDYSVNDLGQRTGVTTDGSAFGWVDRGWIWGYDALGQVTKAQNAADTDLNRAYGFDGIGNRLAATDGTGAGAITTGYTPNALNQYESIETTATLQPDHDFDGNLLADKGVNVRGIALTYVWDGENRLAQVRRASDNALIASYQYDYQSRRILKETFTEAPQGASATAYLYDGWNLLAEYEASTPTTPVRLKTYTWGTDLSGSMQGAGGVGGLLTVSVHNGQSAHHYHPTYDGNGNVSEYLDNTFANEGDVAHYEYDPFGRLAAKSGDWENFAHRFSTKPQDEETGLLYYGYRYLETQTGRWLKRDPIGERGGLNVFGFVAADPISVVDILGLAFKDPEMLEITLDKRPTNWKADQLGGTSADPTIKAKEGTSNSFGTENYDAINKYGREVKRCRVYVKTTIEFDVEFDVFAVVGDQTGKLYTNDGLAAIKAHEQRRIDAWKASYGAYLSRFEEGKFSECSCSGLTRGQVESHKDALKVSLEKFQDKAQDRFLDWGKAQQAAITGENTSYRDQDGNHWAYGNGLFDSISSPHEIGVPPELNMDCPPCAGDQNR